MSEQVTDPFIWNDEEWVFLGADNVYSLFDPKKYGLSPDPPSTACWKGFIIQFEVKDGFLFFDRLEVYCEDEIYPEINGIKSVNGKDGMREYNNIGLKLRYSGTLIVGKNMKEEYHGRAFTGPHSYETTYELLFKKGKYINCRETSGSYVGF